MVAIRSFERTAVSTTAGKLRIETKTYGRFYVQANGRVWRGRERLCPGIERKTGVWREDEPSSKGFTTP